MNPRGEAVPMGGRAPAPWTPGALRGTLISPQGHRATMRHLALSIFPVPALALLLLATLSGLLAIPATAYERERPERPGEGDCVQGKFQFFIAAEGDPDRSERYKIELSQDAFDTILYFFDQTQEPAGWIFGPPEDTLPEGEEGDWWRGMTYRVSETLQDGDYTWRAYKYSGTQFERLRGEVTFRVDTVPPGPVTGVRAIHRDDGSLRLEWEPVLFDVKENPDRVAGYRIYRFTHRGRFRSHTLHLIGETLHTSFVDAYADDGEKLAYYRITAVDEAGNEIDRRRPWPIGYSR